MSTQYITSFGLFYKKVGILLGGLSDCEELVGYSQEMMRVVLEVRRDVAIVNSIQ